MTVRELIDELQKHDGDKRVVVDGYEYGFEDPSVGLAMIVPDDNWKSGRKVTWYAGRHHEFEGARRSSRAIEAVVVSR